MKAHGGRGGIAPTHTLPRPLDGGEWTATRHRRAFPPGKGPPGTHWIGSWVGLRAGLDAGARRKILCPCRGSNLDHPIVHPVVKHYTA
jgi:hypothetical protein